MEKNSLHGKNKVIIMLILLIIIFFVSGCVSTQVGSIEFIDNSIFMIKSYDILSNDLVKIELSQSEAAITSSFDTPETKTIYDRILEQIKIQYPETDAVLIANLEAIKKSITEFVAGSTTSEFIYVAMVYPIKYKNGETISTE